MIVARWNRTSRLSRPALALLVPLCCLPWWAAQVAAEERDPVAEEAASLAAEAAQAYERGDLYEAAQRFREASQLVPDPAFAFNLALVYEERGELYLAHRYYGRYLDLYPGAPNAAEVTRAREALAARFAGELARLEVTTTPGDAEIWIARSPHPAEPYGEAPGVVWVAPGPIRVEARLDGHLPASRSLNAVAGVRIPLELVLLPEATVGESPHPLRPWAWGALGAGAAALGTAVVLWVMADGTAEDYNTAVGAIGTNGPSGSLSDLRDQASRAENQALAGNIVFGVGAVLAIGGGVLWVLSQEAGSAGDPLPRDPHAPQTREEPAWRVGPWGLGLGLTTRF